MPTDQNAVSIPLLATLLGGMILPARAADQPIVLAPVTVDDSQVHDTGLAVLPATVLDTPQAIQVVGADTLKQQQVSSLEGALRNVPGITIAIGEGGTLAGDQFKIRGFDAKDDIYLDGLRDFGVYVRDSFDDEEVQVLKGPSGALFGRGTTGGAINLISKTPLPEDRTTVQVTAGNGPYLRATADLNLVLDDTTAVRLNLMGNWTGVADRDVTYSHRWGVAPSVGFGLGSDTTFTLSLLHQQNDAIPDYGVPVAVDPVTRIAKPVTGKGVPRNTFLGLDSDRDHSTADIVTARLSHRVSDKLTLTNDSRVGIYSRYFQYTTVDRCDETSATNACALAVLADPATAYGGIGGGGPYAQNAWGAQDIATARADFDLGGLHSQFIAGLDVSYQRNKRTFYAYTLPSAADFAYILGDHTASRSNIGVSLLDPLHTPPPGYTVFLPQVNAPLPLSNVTPASNLFAEGDATDLAFFGVERLWLTPQWSVIGNLRWDDYDASYNTRTIGSPGAPSAVSHLNSRSSFVSPRVSLVWEPDERQTYYASWGRASTPQGTSIVGAGTGIAATASDLTPDRSESYELGAKFALGTLTLTGSLFKVNKANALSLDPTTGEVLAQSGEKQRAQGIEIGLDGHLTSAWSLSLSYTWLDTKILQSYSNCIAAPAAGSTPSGIICPAGVPSGTSVLNPIAIGRQITFTPEHAATLWTSYGFGQGFEAGGGLTYQDKLFNAYTGASASTAQPAAIVPYRIVEIPDTVEVDLFAAYELQHWRFALNVLNAADRLNYSQSFGNRGTPAPGRSVLLSAATTF